MKIKTTTNNIGLFNWQVGEKSENVAIQLYVVFVAIYRLYCSSSVEEHCMNMLENGKL